jgi:hypothetical protein
MAYSKIEKYFAYLLSKTPKAKIGIKKLYSLINYHTHKKMYSFCSKFKIEPIISDEDNESFFGYYDKSPVNSSGKYIIFHEISRHGPVKIMLYGIDKSSYETIAESSANNWQQGSKLMWLNEKEFIFNNSENGSYISVIFDIETRTSRKICLPVYDCYKDEFGITVNFSRLKATDSDYGYDSPVFYSQLPEANSDGIFYIDLIKNESKLLISFEQACSLYEKFPENAKQCFNHIMISPDGKNFIFIHRWYISGKRREALLISDVSGNARLLSNNGFVSHCCWNGNKEIIGYLEHPSHGRTFYRIDTNSGKTELLSKKLLGYGDGHPSFFGNKMLFDSYPDRSRIQHLYIYDMIKDEIEKIGSFLSPMKFFASNRCDLHPRWSYCGKEIFFDSTHEVTRKLYKMNINDQR